MLAKDLVSETIPAIQATDKASEALNWMDVFRVSHLPIIEDDEYVGLISDADIFDTNEPSIAVIEHQRALARPFVYENQHIYETIDKVAQNKLSLIPVLTQENKYLGIIRTTDLANHFLHLMSIESPGGILVLEMGTSDYSMAEIAQIVESNDAKILSSFVKTITTSNLLDVTIKVNKTDLSAIIQTFERYSYTIKAIYGNDEELNLMMKDRIDALLKYINI